MRWQRRSVRALAGSAVLLFGIVAVACSGGASSKTSPFTATQLIQKGTTNFNQDTALHFKLTATNVAPGLYAVTAADGDVVRPDKLKLVGSDEVSQGFTAGIGIIFVNSNQYVDFGATGKYTKVTGLPNLLAIFSPQQGIGAILSQMQNPSTPVDDMVDGVACWRINGTVAAGLLAPITGGSATATNPIQTTIWIGESDYQFHKVTLVGKAVDSDSDTTTRTFVLSNFNETVTITAPA
jgi:hypothetical protein